MVKATELPSIIQGGMGIGASGYRLANAVSSHGALGVISGTALDTVFVRRLQDGDPGGHLTRALSTFPFPEIAQAVLDKHLIVGGKGKNTPYRVLPLPTDHMTAERVDVIIVANYAEVFLAKEGHQGSVGINLLTKIQLPTLASLFGAMLANVDVVLMGAGIPSAIPGILDQFSLWQDAELKLVVEDNPEGKVFSNHFSPQTHFRGRSANAESVFANPLLRPNFLAIVSSHILAKNLHKKASGKVDGFVVESHVAGGHNAPPRRTPQRAEPAEPSASPWGPADAADLAVMRTIGLPFWLAGNQSEKGALARAIAEGARGIQVGTPFAFCEESGFETHLKERAIAQAKKNRLQVVTDFEASPTGYPFKIIVDEDQPEEVDALRARERICDLGYLRQAYVDDKGNLGYRCPGEPEGTFEKKGGDPSLTKNKICLCNGLLATVGHGQSKGERAELPILTAGEALSEVLRFLPEGATLYRAEHVLLGLLGS